MDIPFDISLSLVMFAKNFELQIHRRHLMVSVGTGFRAIHFMYDILDQFI